MIRHSRKLKSIPALPSLLSRLSICSNSAIRSRRRVDCNQLFCHNTSYHTTTTCINSIIPRRTNVTETNHIDLNTNYSKAGRGSTRSSYYRPMSTNKELESNDKGEDSDGVSLLDQIEFQQKQGQLKVSILGPSNAGKSTLFNRLMCKESNKSYRLSSEKGSRRPNRSKVCVDV